ncbi:HIT-like domain-containing protein [Mucor lusitanicus]|uniref:HIT-like domain-containing protein n=1 Tax=Mucor circinelloides f. lusitanicus TaxID=29924 RepID=A0A8H4EXT7_MUCCL|nr:HIT-like domain-containing protein [Mucor lusitanicus]
MLCCVAADETCTFCNIKAAIGARLVTETDDLIAFKDRSPSAQVHLLIIPKNHIRTVKNLDGGDVVLLEKMIVLGKELLRQQGFNPDDSTQVRLGFHVPPFNSVNHLHMHVIGLPFKNKYRSFKYRQGYPWYADAKKVLDRLSEGMSPI